MDSPYELQRLVVVATFSTPWEAQVAQARLSAEGLHSLIADEHVIRMVALANAVGGIRLKVREKDAAAAADVLRRLTPLPDIYLVPQDAVAGAGDDSDDGDDGSESSGGETGDSDGGSNLGAIDGGRSYGGAGNRGGSDDGRSESGDGDRRAPSGPLRAVERMVAAAGETPLTAAASGAGERGASTGAAGAGEAAQAGGPGPWAEGDGPLTCPSCDSADLEVERSSRLLLGVLPMSRWGYRCGDCGILWKPDEVEGGRRLDAAILDSAAALAEAGGNEPLITVARFGTPWEAHLARTLLESEGLRCCVLEERMPAVHMLSAEPAAFNRVEVRQADAQRAGEILARAYSYPTLVAAPDADADLDPEPDGSSSNR